MFEISSYTKIFHGHLENHHRGEVRIRRRRKNGQDTAAKAWANWTLSLSIIQKRMNVNFSSPHSNLFFFCAQRNANSGKKFHRYFFSYHIIGEKFHSGLLI